MTRRQRIALIGSRGVPARYGGFETLMAELAPRLVRRGFKVTVYCRKPFAEPGRTKFRGASTVTLPTVSTKHLETPVHTLLAASHAAGRFDAALVVNGANSIFVPILQAAGTRVALNVDGIESQRAKWGVLGRATYSVSERLAANLPDALIADAEVIRRHYAGRYGVEATVLTYGVPGGPLPAGETLDRLGLASRGYFLYVSRFEPENNPHRVVEAYRAVGGEMPLVMVGWAPYAGDFVTKVRERADSRALFPGPVYGDAYRELLSNAYAYVQATEVGGTHPALVEAMGLGNCVLVNDTPENREVAGATGLYFDAHRPETLTRAFDRVRSDPALVDTRGAKARARAEARYSWERIADGYAELFRKLIPS